MDFGDDFASKEEVDPAAEFLAREQSVLGELEAEITGGSATTAPAPVTAADDILLSGGGAELGSELAANVGGGLESSTGSFEVIGGESNEPIGISGPEPSREEPEKIKKWREEQKQRLEQKDIEEERKKEELRQQAKKELDDWLRQIEESIAKTKLSSRNAEKQAASLENGAIEPGTEWERIAKLCDFNPKVNKSGKDVSRMRSIYLHLKQNPIQLQKNA
ncbi:clathrin light chain [Scaptodrosophila lebanonensis]|uniref:Clathrin light chain n=1 Tax=Drosophila lebanonensis TaxID=7225 RepID=A0A6J2T923_DROLE|nr:clathrin light chain [Scaptodrosophila lebanonensis]XP_030373377.1 clathrin light chain [Scaptodrosophila lebanonensis]